MARFHRKSSFHTFSFVTYTHAEPLPPPSNGLLTQINNPNEAFHQSSAYKGCSQRCCCQSGTLIEFHASVSLFTPPRLLSYPSIGMLTKSTSPAFYLKLCQTHLMSVLNRNHKLWQSNHTITHILGKSGVLYMTASPKCRVCFCSVVTCPVLLC